MFFWILDGYIHPDSHTDRIAGFVIIAPDRCLHRRNMLWVILSYVILSMQPIWNFLCRLYKNQVTVHRQAFSELKMPYDTVVAADFADLECEASAKSVTGTRYEWTVTKQAAIFKERQCPAEYQSGHCLSCHFLTVTHFKFFYLLTLTFFMDECFPYTFLPVESIL